MNTIKASSCGRSPSEVQDLLLSLEEARNRVTELRELLTLAEIECNQLETEWFSYEASIAPIRKCPSEILLMVFEIYLAENPRLVRRLLLVCGQWYQIASTSPQLWNRIPVTFEDEWDVESTVRAINKRIEMCILRSGSMLLELVLELDNLYDPRDKIIVRIRAVLRELIGTRFEEDDQFINWTGQVETMDLRPSDYYDGRTDYYDGRTDYQPTHALGILRTLIGEDGECMCRWGSLDLVLPRCNTDLALEIWSCLMYPTPNLTRLAVYNFGKAYPEIQLDVSPAIFPDLASLKQLEMDDAPGLDSISIRNSSLRSLKICGDLATWYSFPLSTFQDLEQLELLKTSDAVSLPFTDILLFSLPRLQELTLRGEFRDLNGVIFEVPRLRSLSIIRSTLYALLPYTPYTNPKVKPINIHWEVGQGWFYYWSSEYLYSEMRQFLLEYTTAEHFSTCWYLRALVIRVLQELLGEGNLSSNLKSVSFRGRDGGLQTATVRDLLEVHVEKDPRGLGWVEVQ